MSNVAYISELTPEQQAYADDSQLKTFYDSKNKMGWFLMKGAPLQVPMARPNGVGVQLPAQSPLSRHGSPV